MSDRSLQATPEGIRQAKVALKGMQLNQTKLANRLEIARKTVSNFFTGKPVSNEIFVQICECLKLDWQVIAEIVGPLNPPILGDFESDSGSAPPELGAGGLPDIEALVQQTRAAIYPLIQEKCGSMRVLDMEQPIELTGERGIYTNVNILEKLTRLKSEQELLANCDLAAGLDRFLLGQVKEKRIPGLEAVENHKRLMVLGKPGAGKTTFLKYLALQCITGGFAADVVPFFVTLKDFAESEDKPNLVTYLATNSPKQIEAEAIEQLLDAGKAMVLLDGLDEVRQEDTTHLIREMRDRADCFPESQFVITCRIAAKEYTFERFTEVEVADFDEQQIATFTENWFRARNDLPKATRFMERLEENKPIQELASSPILLTLLCLVFGEGGDFPSNRADLYEEGVRTLLKKWDATRNIDRDQIYKKLDVQRKEDLLSFVALQSFQQKEYFIKKRRLEGSIADFIGNLRNVDPDPESLRVDSETVVKSIQAQHGLLIERARGIYSFSHLTFQEYFTARELAGTNQIQPLLNNINEKRWREVCLLTVGMLRNADALMLAMQAAINQSLAKDQKLQIFFQWVKNKSKSIQVTDKVKANSVRASYFALARYLDLASDLTSASDLPRDRYLDLARDLTRDRDLARDRDLISDIGIASGIASGIAIASVSDIIRNITSARDITRYIARNIARAHDPELKRQLQEVFDRLPNASPENQENFQQWWKTNSQQWTEDLRQIMITHRNIGHDWKFTDDQKQLLQQYYDANLLLVECLNSDCYVSRSVRQEIEDTLLLPMAEIEKYRREKGQSSQ